LTLPTGTRGCQSQFGSIYFLGNTALLKGVWADEERGKSKDQSKGFLFVSYLSIAGLEERDLCQGVGDEYPANSLELELVSQAY
jgi:hypothetical protein